MSVRLYVGNLSFQLTADEVGAALQDDKASKVKTNFKSSPGAWGGINARIDREKSLFDS